MKDKAKVFQIYDGGAYYYIVATSEEEAKKCLEEHIDETEGDAEDPSEWKIAVVEKPFKITTDERHKNGKPITFKSTDFVESYTSPDIIACSEWY